MFLPDDRWRSIAAVLTMSVAGGCFGGGSAGAIRGPDVDPSTASAAALEMYDNDGDKALGGNELLRVPGIAMFLVEYDRDGDKRVSESELTTRFEQLFASGGAMSRTSCTVFFNGRPLEGAEIVFEPEPFLGDGFKSGRGRTDVDGGTRIAVPDDQLPEANRGLGAIYDGLYKVIITHPQAKIPEAYRGADTVLGHEVSGLTNRGTEAVFRLDSKGSSPVSR